MTMDQYRVSKKLPGKPTTATQAQKEADHARAKAVLAQKEETKAHQAEARAIINLGFKQDSEDRFRKELARMQNAEAIIRKDLARMEGFKDNARDNTALAARAVTYAHRDLVKAQVAVAETQKVAAQAQKRATEEAAKLAKHMADTAALDEKLIAAEKVNTNIAAIKENVNALLEQEKMVVAKKEKAAAAAKKGKTDGVADEADDGLEEGIDVCSLDAMAVNSLNDGGLPLDATAFGAMAKK